MRELVGLVGKLAIKYLAVVDSGVVPGLVTGRSVEVGTEMVDDSGVVSSAGRAVIPSISENANRRSFQFILKPADTKLKTIRKNKFDEHLRGDVNWIYGEHERKTKPDGKISHLIQRNNELGDAMIGNLFC